MQHVARRSDSAPEQRARHYQRCSDRWISAYRRDYHDGEHDGEDELMMEKQL